MYCVSFTYTNFACGCKMLPVIAKVIDFAPNCISKTKCMIIGETYANHAFVCMVCIFFTYD